MRLFDEATVMDYLKTELPAGQEIEMLEKEGFAGAEHYTEVMRKALIYALTKYPEVSRTDVCSWAGLVESYLTGMYSGFGTEMYPKEREADRLVILFAGGWLDEAGELGRTPPLDEAGEVRLPMDKGEWTRDALRLLERFYFGKMTWKEAVGEAIRLLEQGKGDDKLVERARERLESVRETIG